MADDTIDRISRIVDGLTALGAATAGQPVQAEDWNTVVGSVVELARTVLARESVADQTLRAEFAPAGHGHAGQVELGWLDPAARDLLEGGRAERADLASEVRLARRELDTVRGDLDALRQEFNALRRRLDVVDDRNFDHGRRLDQVAVRVDSVREQEVSIADLRTTLAGIDGRVGEALDLREQLVRPDGSRIDLGQLADGVAVVEELRDRLTTADGELGAFRQLERRLVRLETTAGGPGGGFDPGQFRGELLVEVDGRLAARLAERVDPLDTQVGGIRTDVGAVRTRVGELTTDVAATSTRLTTHDTTLAALSSATAPVPDLTRRLGTVETRVSQHASQLSSLGRLEGRVDEAEQQVRVLATVPRRVDALERDVSAAGQVLARVPRLEERMTVIERDRPRLDDLGGRLDLLASDATRVRVQVDDATTRADTLTARADDAANRVGSLERGARTIRDTVTLLSRDLGEARQRLQLPVRPTLPNVGPVIGTGPGGRAIDRPTEPQG
jgi:chromosome segregation ATPase